MNQQSTATTPANGESGLHDLFALTDEQILEIEPQEEVASGESQVTSGEAAGSAAVVRKEVPGYTIQ